jgi:benzoyl-CoA reductase/2-hydroxyglutaryl-CoA dehydratase subunit BcrC/BadD/HgdB
MQANAARPEPVNQLEQLRRCGESRHGYSKSIGELFGLAESYLEDAEAAARGGKDAVWIQGWQEVILAYACGVIPVSYSEVGLVSGEEAIGIAEDYYQVPPETCSMVKASMGEWFLRRDSPIKRICGSDGSCEPYNLAWEIMKKEGYDIHTVDVVYRAPGVEGERYEQLVRHYMDEIYRLAKWLGNGRKLDEGRLILEIRRKNSYMAKLRRILGLRLKHPLYVKSLPIIFLLAGIVHYYGKPEEFGSVLDGIIEELEGCPNDTSEEKGIIPLVWSGGRSQNFSIYEAIDEAGGALLGFVNAPFTRDYREDLPPVEAMARYVLDGQMAGAAIYRRHYVEEQLEKVGARGLILHGFIGCTTGSVTNEMFREYFRKRGYPSITLEGSFQVGAPTGQLLTRVKAFIEMLTEFDPSPELSSRSREEAGDFPEIPDCAEMNCPGACGRKGGARED